jgi:hypothetical protein
MQGCGISRRFAVKSTDSDTSSRIIAGNASHLPGTYYDEAL